MRVAGWLLGCALWALGGAARANDFDQFQNARVAYESQNYELAADLFEGLLSDAGDEDDRPLTVESRKYLAVTYLFLGQEVQAAQQLERLLRAEPDYVLDPLAFPAEFGKMFAAVKERIEEERARETEDRARRQAEQQQQQQLEAENKRLRLERLLELAGTQRVERMRSRWIALLPFGIGQFQNGHNDLGLVLAIVQGTLLAASVTSFALHENLRGQRPDDSQINDAELAEAAFRYTNQISLGLFAAVALTGIIDAQIRFKPSYSFDRPRPLPPDLREFKLSVGLGGFSLSGHF
jgi:tetratricopeptide (TPR) repeat protein